MVKNDTNETQEKEKEMKTEAIFWDDEVNVKKKRLNLTETKLEISPDVKKTSKDEIIFSTVNNSHPPGEGERIQKGSIHNLSQKRKVLMDSSESATSSQLTHNTFSLKTSLKTSNTNFNTNYLELCDFQWEIKTNKPKSAGLSKSDSHVRLNFNCSCFQGRKRSQSLDLGEEKLDLTGNRKLKNFSFNLENVLKAKTNVMTYQALGNSMHENLTLGKCEMGDELIVKERKSNVFEVKTSIVKDTKLLNTLDKDILDVHSLKQNEDEEYRSSKYPKRRLYLPDFPYKSEKLANKCSNPNTDSMVKINKNQSSAQEKLGIKSLRANLENRKKLTSEKEKSTALSQKPTENGIKKEVKGIKKAFVKKGIEKLVKKDGAIDPAKQKLLNRVVKSAIKSVPGYKVQDDKATKGTPENKGIAKSYDVIKHEEKCTEKYELFSTRPSSQPPRKDVESPSFYETKEKAVSGLNKKSPKSLIADKGMRKNSLEGILQAKKTEQILVFDKKADNFLPANIINSSTNHLFSTESSPIVVELFSKKPSLNAFDFDSSDENKNSLHIFSTDTNLSNAVSHGGNNDDPEKPIVKSVWALTKVLLYGDGSKKFEILEASLTPPEYILNNDNLKGDMSR